MVSDWFRWVVIRCNPFSLNCLSTDPGPCGLHLSQILARFAQCMPFAQVKVRYCVVLERDESVLEAKHDFEYVCGSRCTESVQRSLFLLSSIIYPRLMNASHTSCNMQYRIYACNSCVHHIFSCAHRGAQDTNTRVPCDSFQLEPSSEIPKQLAGSWFDAFGCIYIISFHTRRHPANW